MDALLIIRDAQADAVVGTAMLAMEFIDCGRQPGILFTAGALEALDSGLFTWTRALSGQETRYRLADRAPNRGLPVRQRGAGRQLDVLGTLAEASSEGVVMYACPLWGELLGVRDLPDFIQDLPKERLVELLENATTLIGSY